MNLKQYLTYFMLFNAMLGSSAAVHATSVSVMGLFKDKAMVSIDGGKAHTMSVGQILQGVKLVSSHSAEATFEVDGARRALGMGQSFAGNPQSDSRASVSLTADVRGHFMAGGSLNSYPVSFLVDTGATSIASMAPMLGGWGSITRRAEEAQSIPQRGSFPHGESPLIQ